MKRRRLIAIGLFTAISLLIFNSIVGNWHQISLLEPAQAQSNTNSAISLSGETYKESRFEVGILEGYQQKVVSGVPVVESPDGNLAYTVVVKPQVNTQQLDSEALARIAIEEFERGEGFQPGQFRQSGAGEISLPWSATLTMGNNTQPLSGEVLARQRGRNVLLLLISATEAKAEDVPQVLRVLSNSLK
ncbi:MAG: hypothetical protein QNJ68_16350 [Microcoleaceae cyanobacterium MO_207.B10]|nr:hypothetical protein [Microcoleaceae cyanobacterium MO_207.B10]